MRRISSMRCPTRPGIPGRDLSRSIEVTVHVAADRLPLFSMCHGGEFLTGQLVDFDLLPGNVLVGLRRRRQQHGTAKQRGRHDPFTRPDTHRVAPSLLLLRRRISPRQQPPHLAGKVAVDETLQCDAQIRPLVYEPAQARERPTHVTRGLGEDHFHRRRIAGRGRATCR